MSFGALQVAEGLIDEPQVVEIRSLAPTVARRRTDLARAGVVLGGAGVLTPILIYAGDVPERV
jgi:hypothetical protein